MRPDRPLLHFALPHFFGDLRDELRGSSPQHPSNSINRIGRKLKGRRQRQHFEAGAQYVLSNH